jgi:hypothetical protein
MNARGGAIDAMSRLATRDTKEDACRGSRRRISSHGDSTGDVPGTPVRRQHRSQRHRRAHRSSRAARSPQPDDAPALRTGHIDHIASPRAHRRWIAGCFRRSQLRPRPRGGTVTRICVVLGIALALTACSGENLLGISQALDPPSICHDPTELDAVDAFLACASDTDCPCGSRCELGACTYDCRGDSECPSGQVCDERGRCADDDAPPDDEIPGTQGAIVATPLTYELAAPLPAGLPVRQALRLSAVNATVPQVRIAVPVGVTVTCDGTQTLPAGTSCSCATIPPAERTALDPASECFTSNLTVGQTARRLLVERNLAVPLPSNGPDLWSIDIYAGTQHIEIPVRLVDVAIPVLPTVGHYEGRAIAPANLAVAGESIPVTAEVGPLPGFPTGTFRFVISDPSRVLGPNGVLFGSINCVNPPPGMGACAWTVTGAETTAPTTPTVVRSGRTTPVTRGNGTLDGELEPFITGSVTGLNVRWNIALRRTDDSAGVPSHSAQAVPVAAALPGQAAIRALFGPASTLTGPALWNRMEQWDDASVTQSMYQCEWDSGASPNHIACGLGQPNSCQSLAAEYGCLLDSDCACPPPPALCPAECAPKRCVFRASLTDPALTPLHKPLRCAQRYLCQTSATGELRGAELSISKTSAQGALTSPADLACDAPSGAAQGAARFFANHLAQAPLAPSDLLAACMTDLRAAFPTGTSQAQLFASAGCINLPRFFRAAHWASRPAASRPANATPSAEDQAADALFHRLVQEWVQIHTFVAREGNQQEIVATVIKADSTSPYNTAAGTGRVPSRSALLDVLENGWATLLNPAIAVPLANLAPDVLARPDYRTRSYDWRRPDEQTANATLARDDQGLGVAVTMAEGLIAYLELVENDVQAAGFAMSTTERDRALARAAKAMRYATAVDALATQLHARAGTPAPLWAPRMTQAHRQLATAWVKAAAATRRLARGENPLGIDDGDLPLYFVNPTSANERFFASSDYLLGLADDAVDDAMLAYDRAANAWNTWHTHTVNDRLNALASKQRRTEVRVRYGTQIQELCGVKPGLAAQDVLDDWMDTDNNAEPDIDPGLCFLNATGPSACYWDAQAGMNTWASASNDQVAFNVCMGGMLRHRLGGALRWEATRMDTFYRQLGDPAQVLAIGVLKDTANHDLVINRPNGTSERYPIEEWNEHPRLDGDLPAEYVAQAMAVCRAKYPNANPLPIQPPSSPFQNEACYSGKLGEMTLSVHTASRAVDLATSRMGDLIDRYDNAMRSCMILQGGNALINSLESRHANTMAELAFAKETAQAQAAAGSFISAGNVFGGLATFGLTLISGGVGLHGELSVDMIERKQAVAEIRHQELMTEVRNLQQELICFNDAEQHLVGMRTAQQEIALAISERTRALVELGNLKDQVRSAVRDARAAIDREDSTNIPKFAQESWLSGFIDEFHRQMRWAKRVTYLALRAVEYEAQVALVTNREQIFRAIHPTQLEATRSAVHSQVLARNVQGRRPEEFVMQVSLCSYLDSSSAPSGCDVEAFRRRLTDPSNAAYNASGAWIGQWLPFALRPFDQYTDRCAERTWVVAAMILSDGNANIGTTPTASLQLHKRNSFSSQWCDGSSQQPDLYQLSARRPCRNLFLESGPISGNTPAASCSATGHTPAHLVETYFDNSIHPGFGGSTSHPGTQELAGMGLWGDYALFIPRAVVESHVALDHVTDIRLHFDYVSIAKP